MDGWVDAGVLQMYRCLNSIILIVLPNFLTSGQIIPIPTMSMSSTLRNTGTALCVLDDPNMPLPPTKGLFLYLKGDIKVLGRVQQQIRGRRPLWANHTGQEDIAGQQGRGHLRRRPRLLPTRVKPVQRQGDSFLIWEKRWVWPDNRQKRQHHSKQLPSLLINTDQHVVSEVVKESAKRRNWSLTGHPMPLSFLPSSTVKAPSRKQEKMAVLLCRAWR